MQYLLCAKASNVSSKEDNTSIFYSNDLTTSFSPSKHTHWGAPLFML